jgi:hypothetical protein
MSQAFIFFGIILPLVAVALLLWAYWPAAKSNWEDRLNTQADHSRSRRDLPKKYNDEPFRPRCKNFIPDNEAPTDTAFHQATAQVEIKGHAKPHPKPKKH